MKTKTYTDEAGKLGTKPRTGVEAKLDKGRQHPDMGTDPNAHKPQKLGDPEVTQRAKNYDNDVADGWIRGSGGGGCDRPHFDRDTSRKANDAPLSKGGGKDGARNHFSAAHRTFSEK